MVIAAALIYPTTTIRYRLTFEAITDGRQKTGSGVIEVKYSKQSALAAQPPVQIRVAGDATVLDLGNRGAIFALLKARDDSRSGPEYIVLRAFNFPHGAVPDPIDDGLLKLRQLSGKRELPLSSLPMLVHFRDARVQMSVEKIDVRVAEHNIKPGVTSDGGEGDDWPALRKRVLTADILIIGTPIWLGQPSSIAKRVLERMDAFLDETDDKSRMPSFGKVAM